MKKTVSLILNCKMMSLLFAMNFSIAVFKYTCTNNVGAMSKLKREEEEEEERERERGR